MNDIGFANIEVLNAANTKVLAINNTRVSQKKGYGLMTPIATFEVTVSDILNALDVQPVKHGRWIEVTPKHSRCSVCDTTCLIAVYPISKGANFCPNCGARMDGDTE